MQAKYSCLLSLLLALIISGHSILAQSGSNDKPDVHINVNREYDEVGNLIHFDSTYVSMWTSTDSLSADAQQMLDQMFREMERSFESMDHFFKEGFPPMPPMGQLDPMSDPNVNFDDWAPSFFPMDSIMGHYSLDGTSLFRSGLEEQIKKQMELMEQMLQDVKPLVPEDQTPRPDKKSRESGERKI